MIVEQVEEFRKEELQAFMNAMINKMKEAMEKDPTRALRPWNEYSRKYLNSRLRGEMGEWETTVFNLEGRIPYEHLSSEELDSNTLTREHITLILAEMLELLDIANFVFFKYTKLNNTLKELDK